MICNDLSDDTDLKDKSRQMYAKSQKFHMCSTAVKVKLITAYFSDVYMCALRVNSRKTTFQQLIVTLPCLGALAPRGAVGARHDGLPRQFSPLLPVVCHGLSLSEGFAGPLRDVVDPALLACPFFASLQLLPEVSLWLGHPISSHAHTISVFTILQLPGDLRTDLYALWWFSTHVR